MSAHEFTLYDMLWRNACIYGERPAVIHAQGSLTFRDLLGRVDALATGLAALLAEVRRVLASGGLFFLNDWIRTPLQVYLTARTDRTENLDADRWRWFRLFPVHNKYTIEDWQWLLAEGGFRVQCSTQLRSHFQVFVTTPAVG